MERIERPYFPIIYVRGYAMTRDEIVETTSTPFMGFEAGSTKMRQAQDGSIVKFVFESPLIRLMKDHNYRDVYEFGAEQRSRISPRCIVIHRYYDPADPAFGDGKTPTIADAAASLGRRILELRDSICGTNATMRKAFRVYLVAHSMGGLICRCLLQNPDVGTAETRAMVDKVFTYATPHNGIDVAGINVPNLLSVNDMNNFNRSTMGKYLKVPKDKVNTLGDSGFPPERMFCLIGTNSRDYAAAHGLSSFAVGSLSDGLVRIANAYVEGAPRAFVNRSHSGYFGIVNSEEGYQNLVRFLFGDTCATAQLDITALPFPPEIEAARKRGKKIESSYYIEATVAPRGAYTYELTSRTEANQCAIRREYKEMFNADGSIRPEARAPVLFSVFLDSRRIMAGSEIAFSINLAVTNAGYQVDGALFLKNHIPGEHLFRNTLVLFARPAEDGSWRLRYVWADDQWAGGPKNEAELDVARRAAIGIIQQAPNVFTVPLRSGKGFEAALKLSLSDWA
ncbi:MAG: esterase/lipase family protein [Stenotrophomonas sp.]|uniref:esterase/lipase family protein n=1 Tax=Stenotrophomonas sp. TaxID=69392 RepID=UPI003D6D56BE